MTRNEQTMLYAKYLGKFIGLAETADSGLRASLGNEYFVDRLIETLHRYQAEENNLKPIKVEHNWIEKQPLMGDAVRRVMGESYEQEPELEP